MDDRFLIGVRSPNITFDRDRRFGNPLVLRHATILPLIYTSGHFRVRCDCFSCTSHIYIPILNDFFAKNGLV